MIIKYIRYNQSINQSTNKKIDVFFWLVVENNQICIPEIQSNNQALLCMNNALYDDDNDEVEFGNSKMDFIFKAKKK